MEKASKPLNFIYTVCSIRTHCSQIVAFAHRMIIENINLVKPDGTVIFPVPKASDLIDANEKPPKSVGGTWNTRLQLIYAMNQIVRLLQNLKDLMLFGINNKDIDAARDYLYGDRVKFKFFSDPVYDDIDNPTTVSIENHHDSISVQNAVAEIITQLNPLTDISTVINNQHYNMRGLMEGFGSIFMIQTITGNATSAIQKYVTNQKKEIDHLTLILMIALTVIFTLLHVIFLVIIVKTIQKNKNLIYKERGEIEIKNGKIVTYLVESRCSK